MATPDATDAPLAVVVIAHGSRRAAGNESHLALCRALAGATGHRVEPAFLELAEPTLEQAVERVVAAGATAVRVLPHFLHPGNHTVVDIPALVEAAAARHPGVTIEVLAHSGADPALVGLLAAQIDP